jgi:biopolymer transport protein ExbD
MRFPRQAKIFCGPLDPAPVAGLLMLVVLFVLLFSLIYTPGVLVEASAAMADPEGVIQITRNKDVTFQGNAYKPAEFQELRHAIEQAPASLNLSITREPGASVDIENKVKSLLSIQLPKADHWTSTDTPKTIVEINLRGQLYYENQMVDENELKDRLTAWQQMASKESPDLTLVLRADKGVKNEMLMRLRLLADQAHIKYVLLAVNPGAFSATSTIPVRK